MDGNGQIDQIPMFRLTNQGGTATGEIVPFILNHGAIKTTTLPASNFMKTELTIATVDIPLLEFARDAYFQNNPDLQSSRERPQRSQELGLSQEQLANNDDHRWSRSIKLMDSMKTIIWPLSGHKRALLLGL